MYKYVESCLICNKELQLKIKNLFLLLGHLQGPIYFEGNSAIKGFHRNTRNTLLMLIPLNLSHARQHPATI